VARTRTLPNGRKKRYLTEVPDPEERAIMGLIVKLRDQDCMTWDAIRQTIYELRLANPRTGGEWSESRIRRAWRAERVLEIQEARASQDRFDVIGEPAGPTTAIAQAVDSANPSMG
jgi:hypothetical protein